MVAANDTTTFDRLLRLGVRVPTDNLSLLLERGFTRENPRIASGEFAHHWYREVDRGYRQSDRGLARDITRERARLSFISHSLADARRPVNKSQILREAHASHFAVIENADAVRSMPKAALI